MWVQEAPELADGGVDTFTGLCASAQRCQVQGLLVGAGLGQQVLQEVHPVVGDRVQPCCCPQAISPADVWVYRGGSRRCTAGCAGSEVM